MEDNKEEEDDDNYVPPEYGDAARGEAEDAATREVEDQKEPNDVTMMIFAGSLLLQRDSAKVKRRS